MFVNEKRNGELELELRHANSIIFQIKSIFFNCVLLYYALYVVVFSLVLQVFMERPSRKAATMALKTIWGEESSSEDEIDLDDESDETELEDVVEEDNSSDSSDSDESDYEEASLVAKNGEEWSLIPHVMTGRTNSSNILTTALGPKQCVKNLVTEEKEAFELFFTSEMINLIVECTNNEAERRTTSWKATTHDEIKMLIGLLILAGVFKSKGESLESLWGSNGRKIFPQFMSLHRVKSLLRYLRFDDRNTRNNRKAKDKFAPVRELFELLQKQLPKYFNPSESITVDEQLVAFRGRCSFRQYMPFKPAKYGLKFFVATCSETSFVLSLKPYLGKENNEIAVNLGSKVVIELVKNYEGTGRNVTTDNFYTSLDLLRELKRRKLTLVGTIRKHRREIPPMALISKGREINDCRFLYNKDATLLSLIPRKNKTCLILSSMHT